MGKEEQFWDKRWNQLTWSSGDADSQSVSLDEDLSPQQADAYSHLSHLTPGKQSALDSWYKNREQKLTEIIQKLGLRPTSALDIGCGAGHWSEFCHQKFGIPYDRITALDISSTALHYVSQRCPGINTTTAELGTGNLSELGHFDLAIAIGVLHHVITFEKLILTLAEIMSQVDYLVIFPVHMPTLSKKTALSRAKHQHYKRCWTRADYHKAIREIPRGPSVKERKIGRLRYRTYMTLSSI